MPRIKMPRMECPKHGEHTGVIRFDGPPWSEEVQDTVWCLQDIAERLVKDGGEEMSEVDIA